MPPQPNFSVTGMDFYTLNVLAELVESLYPCSDNASSGVYIARQKTSTGVFKGYQAAVMRCENIEFEDSGDESAQEVRRGYVVGPENGNTRHEALTKLLKAVEDGSEKRLKCVDELEVVDEMETGDGNEMLVDREDNDLKSRSQKTRATRRVLAQAKQPGKKSSGHLNMIRGGEEQNEEDATNVQELKAYGSRSMSKDKAKRARQDNENNLEEITEQPALKKKSTTRTRAKASKLYDNELEPSIAPKRTLRNKPPPPSKRVKGKEQVAEESELSGTEESVKASAQRFVKGRPASSMNRYWLRKKTDGETKGKGRGRQTGEC